ncbi:hypothetical protein [Streptomyces sp. NPDC002788]
MDGLHQSRKSPTNRRSLLRGAAAGAAGIVVGAGSTLATPGTARAAGPAGLPTYRYLRDAPALPVEHHPDR